MTATTWFPPNLSELLQECPKYSSFLVKFPALSSCHVFFACCQDAEVSKQKIERMIACGRDDIDTRWKHFTNHWHFFFLEPNIHPRSYAYVNLLSSNPRSAFDWNCIWASTGCHRARVFAFLGWVARDTIIPFSYSDSIQAFLGSSFMREW